MNIFSLPDNSTETPLRIPLHSSSVEKGKQGHALQKIAFPTMEGVTIEKVQNITCLEARGNYTLIHLMEGKQVMVCKTLRDVETLLEGNGHFVRIHRSYTINLDRLVKYFKGKGGYVLMENGFTADVSHTRKHDFLEALRACFGYE